MKNSLPIETLISRKTPLSRRKILSLITEGKISVNGAIVKDLKMPVDPKKDKIVIEGRVLPVGVPKLVYFKFNKPKGVITSMSDPQGRDTVARFLKKIPENIFPIGRLDRDSTGLLLLTNDGDFANKISHPSFHLPKRYRVIVDKILTKNDILRLQNGLFLEDGPFSCDDVIWELQNELILTISQGRNRIIRRAFDQMGYKVRTLKRISIGPIQIDNIAEGQIKPLNKSEFEALKSQLKNTTH
jgi:23S rRNA pseudouridine2605 synthase